MEIPGRKGRKMVQLNNRQKKEMIRGIAAVAVYVLVSLLIMIYAGGPIIEWVKDPVAFRGWVERHGLLGDLAFLGMMVLQVVVAILPGEPFEIAAGYAFGVWEGTFLCLLGTTIGSCLVFWFVRTLGMRVVEIFFSREQIGRLKFLRDEKRLTLLTFIAFFIPGTPKDLLTYAVGLTPMRFKTWLVITVLARIPSIVTSTIGGNALGMQRYVFAIIVFAATLLVSGAGVWAYRRMNR